MSEIKVQLTYVPHVCTAICPPHGQTEKWYYSSSYANFTRFSALILSTLNQHFLAIRMHPVFIYLSYCLHQKADGSLITRQYTGSMMMKHGFNDDESKPTYYRSTLQLMHLQHARTTWIRLNIYSSLKPNVSKRSSDVTQVT